MSQQRTRAGAGKWIGAATAVLLSCGMVSGITVYVAPNGNDSWSGTLAEAKSDKSDGPLASLEGARRAVRIRIAEGLKEPVTVNIRGGEYSLDQTVVFGLEDSGTAECPVTYQAFPGEKPGFTGGKRLTDWKPCTKDPAGLPTAAKGKLFTCDIPADLKGKWQIKTLYDGLDMMPRSSSEQLELADSQIEPPLQGLTKVASNFNLDPKEENPKLVHVSREFRFQNKDLLDWAVPGDIEIFSDGPGQHWLVNVLPLASVDVKNNTALLAIDPTYDFDSKNPYRVQNAIEYLDTPGEWVFSSAEGRVYLWPSRPIKEYDVHAPYLQEFIRIEGVEDKALVRFLNFSGLTFRYGLRDTWQEGDKGLQHDWEMFDKGNAVLRFRHAEDCAVRACDFNSSSGAGVRLDLHCQRITVADSRFAYLGGAGVVLSGYGPGTKDENRNNIISNNLIHHVGDIYWHSPGIFITQSGHNLISHNTIHDLGYNGLVISGCRQSPMVYHKNLRKRREWVSNLRIEECLPVIEKSINEKMSGDEKLALYEPLLHSRENRVEHNEIYRTMLRLGDGNGIYLSGQGDNNQLVRNYLHDIDAIMIRMDNEARFTLLAENVFVNGSMQTFKGPGELRDNIGIDLKSIGPNRPRFTSTRNVFVMQKASDKMKNNFGTWENCILYSASPLKNVDPGQELATEEQRKDGQAGLIYADPLFDPAAMEQKNFRFLPGSPCEKLGIKPLDMSQVGSTVKDPSLEIRRVLDVNEGKASTKTGPAKDD
ncbi:MAG: right-handed parallel beta-helix repeat-containing protein [Bdellovibrionaceae bacterium]|nr:right-handed parallel beta-helix repeat-containing protein [Pseudobdellovibrionaceae bacterium]